jgi:hypothetical protein
MLGVPGAVDRLIGLLGSAANGRAPERTAVWCLK